jgi:protein YIPF5/7
MAEPFGSPLPAQFTYQAPGQQYVANPYQQQPAWNPYSGGGTTGGFSAAPSFEDEPPILEELGIDLQAILKKSRSVLIGRVGADSLKDVDMGGPLLFAAGLAALHLLHGKLHFGVILGWSAVSFTAFWFIVHQLAGLGSQSNKECIDLYNCSACLGYCLLPMLVTNVLAVFLPHASRISIGLFGVASMYCALLAAKLVVKRAPFMAEHFATIAYPALLYYVTLALISLY